MASKSNSARFGSPINPLFLSFPSLSSWSLLSLTTSSQLSSEVWTPSLSFHYFFPSLLHWLILTQWMLFSLVLSRLEGYSSITTEVSSRVAKIFIMQFMNTVIYFLFKHASELTKFAALMSIRLLNLYFVAQTQTGFNHPHYECENHRRSIRFLNWVPPLRNICGFRATLVQDSWINNCKLSLRFSFTFSKWMGPVGYCFLLINSSCWKW